MTEIIDVIDAKTLNELYKGSAFTFEGIRMNSTQEADEMFDFLDEKVGIIDRTIYRITGKFMNTMYNLSGRNRYPDDLTIVSIPLDSFKNQNKLPMFKIQMGARWFDDIVDNNARREGEDGVTLITRSLYHKVNAGCGKWKHIKEYYEKKKKAKKKVKSHSDGYFFIIDYGNYGRVYSFHFTGGFDSFDEAYQGAWDYIKDEYKITEEDILEEDAGYIDDEEPNDMGDVILYENCITLKGEDALPLDIQIGLMG